MLPQRSHITRKRSVYYYRRRLPSRWPGEVTLSLRTASFREAEWLAERLDHAFEAVVGNMGDKPDVQKAVTKYLRKRLASDMHWRTASPGKPVYDVFADEGASAMQADLEWVQSELKAARRELVDRSYGHQRPLIDDILEEYSLPEAARDELAHGILRANVELWATIEKRTKGEFPDLVQVSAPVAPSAEIEAQAVSPATTVPAPPSAPKLSKILPPYIAHMVERKGWRGQTKAQSETTLKMFREHCGDLPIDEYTRPHLASFYDLLCQLPALYSKKAEWKDLAPREVVARTKDQECERMTMKTVKRHFSALGTLFTYLKKRGAYAGENPAHGFEFPEKGRANQKRKMWDDEKLAKLFATPVWQGCVSEGRRNHSGSVIIKDERYWLPLLGVYHGNRLEEFAQLKRSDVRREGDIWYFDINDDGEKQLKNEQSKRRVPLHPRLKKLGFLKYVEATAPKPEDDLFPELRPGGPDNKLGYYFSKWFSRYRQDVGVYEKKLDYHSFRHGVITQLYAAEVPEPIIDELTGHEGGGVGRQVYKKALPLDRLLAAISKVEWPTIKLPE